MKYHTKLTFKIYLQHALRYKLMFFVILASAVFASVSDLVAPFLYKEFFDILTDSSITEAKAELIRILLFILGIHMLTTLFWRISFFTNNRFQPKVMADLANTCFAYLHKHSFSFFNNNFVGSLVKRVNRFYRAFEALSDRLMFDLLKLAIEVTVITAVLFTKSVILGISILLWTILFVALNYFYSVFKLKYDIERSEQDTKVTGVLADSVTNQSNIKLFAGYDRERKRFGSVTEELRRLRTLTWDLGQIAESVQILLMIALEVILMYFAIGLWEQGVLSIGDFVLLQAYLMSLFNHIWSFGRIIRDFYEQLADAEEMTVILDTPHEVKDKKRAGLLDVKKAKIKFDNVDFYYHKTRKVIDKLKLIIKPGEKVALVGPSGAGKSTIIKLLLRIHDVSGGKIFIDEQNIANVSQDSLHQAISLVPQDPILFHRTLLENIRYAKPNATEEEVIKAAELAHCHEFIKDFPEGYNTYVGERGVKLSGGERQRVAIARAILSNSPILILDEATSSLDSESEKLIQDALDQLMKKKTVIVVAHRLSTIMKMDRILVVEGGKIVEQGSHKELLKKKKGIYSRLWKYQAGGFTKT